MRPILSQAAVASNAPKALGRVFKPQNPKRKAQAPPTPAHGGAIRAKPAYAGSKP